jgi:hypothetical protein
MPSGRLPETYSFRGLRVAPPPPAEAGGCNLGWVLGNYFPISMIDQRGRLLMAALGFAGCSMPSYDRALHALRARATTYNSRATEHSPTSATGTGWERTPWHATQRVAWEALSKAND